MNYGNEYDKEQLEKKDSDTEKRCPLSLNDWVMFLNNETNNLESGECQKYNSFIVIVALIVTAATALISWLLATVAIANPPQNAFINLSQNTIINIIYAIIIGFVIISISSIFFILYFLSRTIWVYPKTGKISHGLKDIIKSIINGDLKDTDEVRKKWELLMQSSDKEIRKKLTDKKNPETFKAFNNINKYINIKFPIISFLKEEVSKKNSQTVKLIDRIRFWLNAYYFILIFFFIFLAFLKLFALIVSKEANFTSIISYGERGTILIATLVILTFTYAAALENRDTVIRSGEYFLKSLLNFVVGMLFLTGFKDYLINPTNVLGLSNIIFNFSIFLISLFFLSGFVMLILSALFLVLGLMHLLKSLQNKTKTLA